MKRFVYADNAATTKLDSRVLEEMLPYLKDIYGNPSSIHAKGRESNTAVSMAREKTAKLINCDPKEIFFTGGGSEADNWAIRGAAALKKAKGRHIITTAIEHHAVLHTLKALEKEGYEVTYLPVYDNGIVKVSDLEKAIRPDTILITVMFANNEIGTIQPIDEIGKIAKEHGILFHTDAVQAAGHVPIDVKALNVDMLSLAAHKFNGPKGVGALYVKSSVRLPSFIYGGGQERGRRAGTENVSGIVGLAKALELSLENLDEKTTHVTAMRDRFIDTVLKNIPYTRLNGDRNKRLPGNINISVEYIEGESLLMLLDMAGICASSGSACTSGSLDPSHVLLAMGLSHETAHGSLRLSIDYSNTDEDIDYIIETLPGVVSRLREMSPLWEKVRE